LEEIRSPVGRPDFKSGKGRQSVLGGFDSHSFPPTISSSCAMGSFCTGVGAERNSASIHS
jgi:hypothetical protein